MVIAQEIFGLTGHIRAVTEDYAARGYHAIAPALFDRVQRGVTLDYTDVEQGRALMAKLDLDDVIADIGAAAELVRPAGKVGVVGYCWGGAIADLAACRAEIDAAASYYGRMTLEWLDLRPVCPVIYHFGAEDPLIPPDAVERIRAARPDGEFHVYEGAGHGFNCADRDDYHAPSAELALRRTLEFFDRWLVS